MLAYTYHTWILWVLKEAKSRRFESEFAPNFHAFHLFYVPNLQTTCPTRPTSVER